MLVVYIWSMHAPAVLFWIFFLYFLSAGLTKEKAPEESVYEPEYCEKYGVTGVILKTASRSALMRYDTGNCVTHGCLCTNLPCRGKKLND